MFMTHLSHSAQFLLGNIMLNMSFNNFDNIQVTKSKEKQEKPHAVNEYLPFLHLNASLSNFVLIYKYV